MEYKISLELDKQLHNKMTSFNDDNTCKKQPQLIFKKINVINTSSKLTS